MKLLNVQKVEDVTNNLKIEFEKLIKVESLCTIDAMGYYLAEDVFSPINVPEFNKSRVDGYAVLNKDCKIASESSPAILNYIGELNIGTENNILLKTDECMYIPTGGMLPKNADAMIMIENTEVLNDDMIIINKSSVKNGNITFEGDDVKKNSLVLKKGTLIDERAIGVLCSMGILEIKVYKKMKVFILSTGDELINVNETPKIGQVRDINSIYCKNALLKNNFEVIGVDMIKDDKELYKEKILNIMDNTDVDLIITSGGSSKGVKDFTIDVFKEITGEVFCEGIGIKPGKPTILAKNDKTLFIGLPGHPVSSYMVLNHIILNSYFKALNVLKKNKIIGKIKHNVANSQGRDMLYLCKVLKENNEHIVEPIYYNSTNIGILSQADGYFVIKETMEGIEKDDKVEVHLF